MIKLIFLDIDGVLNQHEYNINTGCCTIDKDKAALITNLAIDTNSNIVISSAWRYMVYGGAMTMIGFNYLLNTHGLPKIHGITRQDLSQNEPRGFQITDYLKNFNPSKYIIFDDLCPNLFLGHEKSFIHIDGTLGININDINKGKNILND